MFRRLLICFVALMLFGSGLQAVAGPCDAAEMIGTSAAGAEAAVHAGIDAHRAALDGADLAAALLLDDRPAPAPLEPAAENLGLLPAPWRAWPPQALALPPRSALQAGVDSPDLAGPLRPPCGGALRG